MPSFMFPSILRFDACLLIFVLLNIEVMVGVSVDQEVVSKKIPLIILTVQQQLMEGILLYFLGTKSTINIIIKQSKRFSIYINGIFQSNRNYKLYSFHLTIQIFPTSLLTFYLNLLHNILPMELPSNKQALPKTISQLLLRHSALFLQRLVLLQPQEDSDHNVKHYDHQCEGVEILVGFFKTKHQNTLLKAFTSLRDYCIETIIVSAPATQRCTKGITTRTDLKSHYTGSEYSPIGEYPLHTFRSTGDALSKHSVERQKSANLQQLLKKVKEANSRHDNNYSFQECFSRNELRENSSYCLNKGQRSHANLYHHHQLLLPNSSRLTDTYKCQPCSSHSIYSGQSSYRQLQPSYGRGRGQQNQFDTSMIVRKKERRDLILSKFQRLEQGLGELGQSKKLRSRLNNEIMREIDRIKQRLHLRL